MEPERDRRHTTPLTKRAPSGVLAVVSGASHVSSSPDALGRCPRYALQQGRGQTLAWHRGDQPRGETHEHCRLRKRAPPPTRPPSQRPRRNPGRTTPRRARDDGDRDGARNDHDHPEVNSSSQKTDRRRRRAATASLTSAAEAEPDGELLAGYRDQPSAWLPDVVADVQRPAAPRACPRRDLGRNRRVGFRQPLEKLASPHESDRTWLPPFLDNSEASPSGRLRTSFLRGFALAALTNLAQNERATPRRSWPCSLLAACHGPDIVAGVDLSPLASRSEAGMRPETGAGRDSADGLTDASEAPGADSGVGVIPMACATLRQCCDGDSVPAAPCPQVVAAGNDVFCSLALISTTGGEQEPGEPYCPGLSDSSDAGPCIELCTETPDPVSFGPVTDPRCIALNECCFSVDASGGAATCTLVALEDYGPACTATLTTFQGLGACPHVDAG